MYNNSIPCDTISRVDRTLSLLYKPTWKTKLLHTKTWYRFFTYFTLQWRNNAYLLCHTNHVAAFKVCQKCHTLTFHWARTWIAQKCASGGDRITTVHWNHLSHRPRTRALLGQWKIVVTECKFCVWRMNHLVLYVIIWLRVQMMETMKTFKAVVILNPAHLA